MSIRRQTFTDPQTGEEIASTWLARWGAGLGFGLVFWLTSGVACGLIGWLISGLTEGLGFGLAEGLATGLFAGLVGWLVGLCAPLGKVRNTMLTRWIHDSIARQQHLRHQRILRQQEYLHVPDGALSRAELPGKPEPTPMSLSPAEPAEKEAPPRLTENVDAPAEAEVQTNPSQPRGEPT